MNYFKVYTSDNVRYVRDLTYRLLRDEQMTTKTKTEHEYVVAIYTKEDWEKINAKQFGEKK